ncbi:MAG: hypothetical protein ACRBBZ_01780 [Nitrosopumilus sp.]
MKITKFFSIAIFVFILVSAPSINHVFGSEIKYDPNEVVVRNNPTICSISSVDLDLTKNQLEKFSAQTSSAINEWEQHLKSKAGKNNWSNWELDHKHFSSEKLDVNSLADCDMVVVFSKNPSNLSFWGVLGVALPDYETGKTIIEIYYLIPKLCDSGDREREGNIIYILQVPCYGEMMVSDHLGAVLRHEIGHGLGLGHYKSSDEQVTLDWNKGLSPTPSIMVETSYENSDELRIAPKDISKLFEIYGDDGFYLNSKEKQDLTLVNPYLIEQDYVDLNNNDYKFTIQYPEKWEVDDNVSVVDDFTSVLYMTDNEDSLNRSLEIGFYNKSQLISSDDNIIIDELIKNEKKYCDEFLSEDFNFDCTNLVFIDSKIQNVQNKKIYSLQTIWNDGTSYQTIHRNYVFSDDKIWEISGYSALAPYLLTKNVMEHSMNSFKLETPNVSTLYTLEEKTQDTTYLESDKESSNSKLPIWIRTNVEWWAQGVIDDSEFVSGIQYLIKEGVVIIPETIKLEGEITSDEIPSWIKNNAEWWSQGLLTDNDFIKGIQFLIEHGIIEV